VKHENEEDVKREAKAEREEKGQSSSVGWSEQSEHQHVRFQHTVSSEFPKMIKP
jgi:hypothetical protein